MKIKSALFFIILSCNACVPASIAMEQAQSIAPAQDIQQRQKRSAVELETAAESQEAKKAKLMQQPAPWESKEYLESISKIVPKKLKRPSAEYSKFAPAKTPGLATPKARIKRITLAQIQEALSHYRTTYAPAPEPVAPPLSLQPTSAFEKHALIQALEKAVVIDKDFNRYFSLLATETPEKQKLLCEVPLFKKNGSKAIHFAAEQGNIEAIRRLEQLGAALDEPNKNGVTPFLYAAHESFPAMQLLIEKGVNKQHCNKNGSNALFMAAQKGNIPAIISLIKDHNFDPNDRRFDGERPLHTAARNGQDEAIRVLVEHGAHKDPLDNYGLTILHQAAKNGHLSTLALLIKELGCDPNSIDNKGKRTPAQIAACSGQEKAVDFLLAHGAQKDMLLHYAAENGYVSIIVSLIKNHGLDPNSTLLHNGLTPLHAAAMNGHCDAIKTLISNGALTNLSDIHDRTILDYAIAHGKTDVIDLLVKNYGFDPNTKKPNGAVPLYSAAFNGQAEAFKTSFFRMELLKIPVETMDGMLFIARRAEEKYPQS